MNKKIILTTAAVLATVATAGGVKADEFNGDLTKDSIGLTAETGNSTSATEATVSSAQGEHEGNPGNIEGDRAVDEEDPSRGSNATSFAKDGDIIRVENPEVVIDQSKGTGKYQGFTVEYKNVHFPDDMQINQGDKVTFNLPEEITFQTAYEFDVTNPDNNVVGKASTDPASQTVTTVFNDYFANHPLNKQMSLKLDAKWTDKVESGKPVTVNFNGTVVSATIGKEQEIGKDELISKWGSQDKEDPTTINWTIRLNYARKTLNYVKLIDEMSDNQKLVDDYFVMNYVDSIDTWVDKGSAMDLIKSMSKSEHGFEITMDRLDRMVYIWYKTKLTNAVKDSTNPINKVELKAENDGATSKSSAHLVGGKGDASGENKPETTFEIPKESPKVEIPEFEGGIPGIPEVREKPEYTEPIGTVPNDSPNEPVKPTPEPKADQPQPKPEPKQDKPNTPAPKTETKKETVEVVNQGETKQDEPVEAYSAPAVLSATGSDLGLSLVALGISMATLAFTLKKKEN